MCCVLVSKRSSHTSLIHQTRTCLATGPAISEETGKMMPGAFAGAAKAGLAMAGPPASAYYTWDSSPGGTTKFTCGPSVAGGAAADGLAKDPDGDDSGLGVRKAGGCKSVTTVGNKRAVTCVLLYGISIDDDITTDLS